MGTRPHISSSLSSLKNAFMIGLGTCPNIPGTFLYLSRPNISPYWPGCLLKHNYNFACVLVQIYLRIGIGTRPNVYLRSGFCTRPKIYIVLTRLHARHTILPTYWRRYSLQSICVLTLVSSHCPGFCPNLSTFLSKYIYVDL